MVSMILQRRESRSRAAPAGRAEPRTSIQNFEREVARHNQDDALVGGGDDVEEQLGTDLGSEDVAHLVKREEIELGQLAPQPEERPFVSCLDEKESPARWCRRTGPGRP